MALLHLLRHGKASSHTLAGPGFTPETYDVLHPQGVEQARLLGVALARRGVSFDRVLCGPSQRHAQTFLALSGAAPELSWPTLEPCESLREVALDSLLRARLPGLLDSVAGLRLIWRELEDEPPGAPITEASPLARLFSYAAVEWCSGRLDAPGVETWLAFRERVRSAFSTISSDSHGFANVLVISSMGVISGMLDVVDHGQHEPERMPFRWLATSSISRIVVDKTRSTIQSTNDVEHLAGQPFLITVL